jgi:type III secretory pathway component EscR
MSSKKKQKQISIEEYIETYCQEKRIRDRFSVYISPEVHRSLKRIVWLFKSKYHSTTSSIADSIISHHIKTYRDLLNNAIEEEKRDFLEGMKGKSNSEECESYEEED